MKDKELFSPEMQFVLTHVLLQYVNHKDFFNVILHMFHNKNVNTYMFSFRYCILMQYCSVKIKNNNIIIFNTGNVFSLGPTSIGFSHEIIKLKRQSFKSSMNSDIDTNHL